MPFQISAFEADAAYPVSAAICSLGRAVLECGDSLSKEQKLKALSVVWNTVQVGDIKVFQ